MKILIIDLNYMGDMLMDSAAFRWLGEHYETDILSYEENFLLLSQFPFFKNVYRVKNNFFGLVLSCLTLRGKYDIVIQFNTSMKVGFLMFLIGGRRIGYAYKWKGLFLSEKVPIAHKTLTVENRISETLRLLETVFNVKIEDREMIAPELLLPKPYVVICPSPARDYDTRRWDIKKFAQLADELAKDFPVIFVGMRKDYGYIAQIRACMERNFRSYNYAGKTDLTKLKEVLQVAKLIVTVNTFTMHLSRALNCNTVAIIGGTKPEVIVSPSPYFKYVQCPSFLHGGKPRLKDVSVNDVLAEVKKLI